MRCDRCPLSPIAEDDCCPLADSEIGMEHKDGVVGCRHSWNWCKKKDEERAEYLGQMADGMLKMMNTPKEPILIEDKMWTCPVCYNNLQFKYKRYPTELNGRGFDRCLACGQKIDWSVIR